MIELPDLILAKEDSSWTEDKFASEEAKLFINNEKVKPLLIAALETSLYGATISRLQNLERAVNEFIALAPKPKKDEMS